MLQLCAACSRKWNNKSSQLFWLLFSISLVYEYFHVVPSLLTWCGNTSALLSLLAELPPECTLALCTQCGRCWCEEAPLLNGDSHCTVIPPPPQWQHSSSLHSVPLRPPWFSPLSLHPSLPQRKENSGGHMRGVYFWLPLSGQAELPARLCECLNSKIGPEIRFSGSSSGARTLGQTLARTLARMLARMPCSEHLDLTCDL